MLHDHVLTDFTARGIPEAQVRRFARSHRQTASHGFPVASPPVEQRLCAGGVAAHLVGVEADAEAGGARDCQHAV